MKLSKVELYVWGFNDDKDVDAKEFFEYARDREKRDVVLVVGDISTIDLPNPIDDNYPLNREGSLDYCRSLNWNKIKDISVSKTKLHMAKLSEYVTIVQQPQDLLGMRMGYLRRLNLSNEEIEDLIDWLYENKNELFWNTICQPCADMNWDGG